MTEQATEAVWEAEDVDAQEGTQDVTESTETNEQADVDHEDAGNSPNSEAKRYRLQLREAQAELESVRGQLEGAQRAQVESLADGRIKTEALWASGVELADLLGDDGAPDAGKVEAAVNAARERFGIDKAPPSRRPREKFRNPAQGASAMGDPFADDRPSWSQVLRGQ